MKETFQTIGKKLDLLTDHIIELTGLMKKVLDMAEQDSIAAQEMMSSGLGKELFEAILGAKAE